MGGSAIAAVPAPVGCTVISLFKGLRFSLDVGARFPTFRSPKCEETPLPQKTLSTKLKPRTSKNRMKTALLLSSFFVAVSVGIGAVAGWLKGISEGIRMADRAREDEIHENED